MTSLHVNAAVYACTVRVPSCCVIIIVLLLTIECVMAVLWVNRNSGPVFRRLCTKVVTTSRNWNSYMYMYHLYRYWYLDHWYWYYTVSQL